MIIDRATPATQNGHDKSFWHRFQAMTRTFNKRKLSSCWSIRKSHISLWCWHSCTYTQIQAHTFPFCTNSPIVILACKPGPVLLLSWNVGIKVCHQKSAKAPFLSPIVPTLPSLQCWALGFPTFLAKELDLRRVYTKKKVEELSQAMNLELGPCCNLSGPFSRLHRSVRS